MPHAHVSPPDMSPSSSTTLALMNVCLADTRDTTWPPPCIFLLQVAQRAHGLQPRCRVNLLLRDLSDDGAQNPPWPLARPAVLLSLGCYCVLARALCPMFLEAQRAILTRCPPYELTCVCSSAGWEASRLLNGRRSIAAIAPHNYIRSTLSARATSARASSARSPLRLTLLWLALLLLALLPLALPPLRCSAARSLRRHSLHRPLPRSTVGLLPSSTASLAPLPRADCRLHAPFKQHDAVGAPLAL